MDAETAVTSAEAGIRALVESWLGAVRKGDMDAIMAHYAPDVRAFDAIGRLQFRGVDAYRAHWEACLAMCPGPMIFEMHELEVAAGEDTAFCHYLGRCGTTDENGEEKAGWTRATICCRRTGGQWKIAHEHFSAPFDPESGNALLGLEP